MLDLGRHAEFIWLSYGAVAFVAVALVIWLVVDGRRNRRRLHQLEAQGARRHGSGGLKQAATDDE